MRYFSLGDQRAFLHNLDPQQPFTVLPRQRQEIVASTSIVCPRVRRHLVDPLRACTVTLQLPPDSRRVFDPRRGLQLNSSDKPIDEKVRHSLYSMQTFFVK